MISLIVESYFSLFLSIVMSAIFLFILGLYFIGRKMKSSSHLSLLEKTLRQEDKLTDLSAIAGEDLIVTQLDLARAYIETDKKPLAKQILEAVIAKGNTMQQK